MTATVIHTIAPQILHKRRTYSLCFLPRTDRLCVSFRAKSPKHISRLPLHHFIFGFGISPLLYFVYFVIVISCPNTLFFEDFGTKYDSLIHRLQLPCPVYQVLEASAPPLKPISPWLLRNLQVAPFFFPFKWQYKILMNWRTEMSCLIWI